MYYAFGFAKIKYLFCVVGAFVNMIVHCNALNLFELVSVYSCWKTVQIFDPGGETSHWLIPCGESKVIGQATKAQFTVFT